MEKQPRIEWNMKERDKKTPTPPPWHVRLWRGFWGFLRRIRIEIH